MKKNEPEGLTPGKKWVGYRPEIKLLDCTIRDGGLMNDHNFDKTLVKAVYNACVDSGMDYMELGYKGDKNIFCGSKYGPWKFSSEDDIREVVGDNDTNLKLSVMADAERTDYHRDIVPRDQSPLDMIRVAAYIHQIPMAIDMLKDAHDKGYETCINLMSISTVQERELDYAIEALAVNSPAKVIYLVDSFGALYSEQIHQLTRKYLDFALPNGKDVGIHAHNNQQLAYANTIEAIIEGANYLDASIAGLGRGAGNCQSELLLAFLHNPKFNLRPMLKCIQDHIEPMREKLGWGFDWPYMLTGMLNQHPRAAMAFNASPSRGKIVEFFDSVIEEE